jgi:hypothetical protein
MLAHPSLVLASTRPVWERLRDASGARALAVSLDAAEGEGDVRWVPLEDAGEADDADGWLARLNTLAAAPRAPMGIVWVASRRGDAVRLLEALDVLGRRMLGSLQRDRVPPSIAAIVYVAEDGLSEDDALALEILGSGGRNLGELAAGIPAGTAQVLGPRGRPVYLMNRRTRVGTEGRSWPVHDIWPIEVGRLLASIAASPGRQPGVRAWRSMRFNPTRFPFEEVEVEAFRMAREALGVPSGEGAPVREGEGRQLPVARAPEKLVATDRVPQHCYDSVIRPGRSPELPDWWDLGAASAEKRVDERTDTSGSRSGRQSQWFRRFDERGRVFIDDRATLALQSLEETMGPKAIQSRAWRAIHDDVSVLPWYGSGQFYRGPDARVDSPPDGLRQWQGLSEIERRLIALRRTTLAEGRELDVARAHFVGLGWRFACAVATSLFLASVFASVLSRAGWRWSLGVSAAIAASACIASLVVLFLEVRAGRRGRDAVERATQHAEASIAEGFLERMRIGAEGERSGRRLRWFQAAARARDSAVRLKAVADLAEVRALKHAASDAPDLGVSLREYADASTVEVPDSALSIDDLRRALRSDGRNVVDARRRAFDVWWSEALRSEDPLTLGAVRDRIFGPRLARAVSALADAFRGDLIRAVDSIGAAADADWSAQSRFGEYLGPSDDLRNLSVQTERARGREAFRVVWVHCALRRHAMVAASQISAHFGHATSAQAVEASIDRWGAMGLMIDEIGIGFRVGACAAMCIDPNGGVCVWEGVDAGVGLREQAHA